jgi:hypothetical protein
MTRRLELPKFQAFDGNGDPLSGGKVYTYEAGTSTLKTSYSDYDASTPNANPVILDSRGEADIYVQGAYKITVHTSADVLVWTLDNVQGGIGPDGLGEDYYYPDSTAADQGVTGNSDTIKYAVDTISTDEGTIYLSHDSGSATTTYTLTTSESIPSGIKVIIENGAIIDGAGTLTLDKPSQVVAPLTQKVFGSSITIAYTNSGTESPRRFGALGDDSNDDTAAFQSAIEAALSTSGGKLFIPNGTYAITSAISFVQYDGFIIEGESQGGTFIKQWTSDTPIFKFTKENTHTFKITDIYFKYNAQQTSTETESVAIYFDFDASTGDGAYNFQIERCQFDNVYKGVGLDNVASHTIWGCAFNYLYYNSTCTGPIIDAYTAVSSTGKPNISARHLYIRADSVENTQPILRFQGCKNLQLDNIEYNQILNGATALVLSSGTTASIGCLRLDTASYTTNDDSFIDFSDSFAKIAVIQIGSATFNITGADEYFSILRSRGGANSSLIIGEIYLSTNTFTDGDTWFAYGKDTTQRIKIDSIVDDGSNFVLTNIASDTAGETIFVEGWNKPTMSADRGNNSVTLNVLSDQVQIFETELTANRTVTLPEHEVNPSNVFEGLTYKIIRNAATPGAFTLTVQDNDAVQIGQLANSTNGAITVMFRRLDWELIGSETW